MKRTRTALTICTILTLGAGMTGCSVYPEPDEMGLYYMQGSSDGNKFERCVDPGESVNEWDNEVIRLPDNVRTWRISPDQGADSNTPIVVSAKPQEGQPSGVQVKVWAQVTLHLNTNCNDEDGGPLKAFWESLGRRYSANTPEGFATKLLPAVIVDPLKMVIGEEVKAYTADDLVARKDMKLIQERIAARFGEEVDKLAGGKYFCGPSFKRGSVDCPPIEVIITDVDLANEDLQKARDAKQKAIEEAAAAVAAAEGQVQAAKKLETLYQNQAWLALEKAKLELQQAQACAASPNCTIILGNPNRVSVGK